MGYYYCFFMVEGLNLRLLGMGIQRIYKTDVVYGLISLQFQMQFYWKVSFQSGDIVFQDIRFFGVNGKSQKLYVWIDFSVFQSRLL